MPCCSANDVMANAMPVVTSLEAVTGAGCWRERCKNEELGLKPCKAGECVRDGAGNPSKPHKRPPCPEHDLPGQARPFGLAAAAPTAAKKPRVAKKAVGKKAVGKKAVAKKAVAKKAVAKKRTATKKRRPTKKPR